MLLSAVGLFSFVVRAFDLTLSDFMLEVVTAYREIFHPIVDFLFSPLPWTLSETQKDALVVYVAVGGATARTFWNEVAETRRIAKFHSRIPPSYRWQTSWLALVSILAWPITWVHLFAQPYFYAQKRGEGRFRFAGR